MTQKIIAIPAEKLGVLEHQIQEMANGKTKRERRNTMARLARVLKDLKMVPATIHAISFGVDHLGGLQAFVVCEIEDASVRAQVPFKIEHYFEEGEGGTCKICGDSKEAHQT